MEKFEVGDLVRDKLNEGDSSYGLGVIVTVDDETFPAGEVDPTRRWKKEIAALRPPPGKRYDVYFNKFERTITFHGDYLEKV